MGDSSNNNNMVILSTINLSNFKDFLSEGNATLNHIDKHGCVLCKQQT